MNAEVFSEWFRQQGHRVISTNSSYWVEASPNIYQAFPYHCIISPTEEELRSFLLTHNAIGLRYSTSWDTVNATPSYHVVFDRPAYPIGSLAKKARYDVKRGLKNAHIEPISFTRLAEEGWQVRLETLERQGRIGAESPVWWRNLCLSAEGLPGFAAWAAVVDNRIAATLLAFTCDNCCSILYQQSRTEYLPLSVNNALTFVFTNEMLEKNPGVWFFYGLHSLDAPSSVDEFKFRMGYKAKPVRQRVVFHPLLKPFFNKFSHRLLTIAGQKWPGNSKLVKAEGMVRFFLEGKLPLQDQKWPTCLLKRHSS